MSGIFGRTLRWVSPLLGLVTTGAAASGPVAPTAAPVSWVRYAEQATVSLTQWLGGDEPAAVEIRSSLMTDDAGGVRTPPPLVLSLWIDGDRISNVRVGSLADPAAGERLRAFLVGRPFGSPPPKGMRQPVNVAVQLDLQGEGER